MNTKIIKLNKGFVTLKDYSICIFLPERDKIVEFFKKETTDKYKTLIISYYNTFKTINNLYIENFKITEFMDELSNEVYIYGECSKVKFIDKKEITIIKRRIIVSNILNIE